MYNLIILCQISNKQIRFQAKKKKLHKPPIQQNTQYVHHESDTIYIYVTYFEKKFIFLNTKQAKKKRKDKTKIK